MSIKVGILGISGYTGLELVKLILAHPHFELSYAGASSESRLSSLIADKEMQVDPDATVDKVDYKLDCSTLTSYSWTGSPETVVTEWNKDGAVVIYNPEVIDPWYTLQYWLVNGISLEEGKTYKISIECKAEGAEEPNVRFKIGDWNGGDTRNFNIPVGGDYDVVEFNVTPTMASNGLFFQHGDFAGTIYWKSITISHSEAPSFEIFTDQVTNGSMEVGQPMDNFVGAFDDSRDVGHHERSVVVVAYNAEIRFKRRECIIGNLGLCRGH